MAKLQSRRFELKYLIDEPTARAVREYVRMRLDADDYCAPDQPDGYYVYSLYLDSPTLILRQHTLDGLRDRFKLRIRFYNDDPSQPAFLEIKRRSTDVIMKDRAPLRREGVLDVLDGRPPNLSHLLSQEAKSIEALRSFCRLRDRLRAKGAVFVCYQREAYVSPNGNHVRITFDRNLESRPYQVGKGLVLPTKKLAPPINGVVLEIKFTDRFPHWTREMVQAFHLQRCAMPKYVECVNVTRRLKGRGLHSGAMA